jgi:TRAP-type C4-dicarboxylate transport system permease small subunit
VHLVCFTIEMYYESQSYKRQTLIFIFHYLLVICMAHYCRPSYEWTNMGTGWSYSAVCWVLPNFMCVCVFVCVCVCVCLCVANKVPEAVNSTV